MEFHLSFSITVTLVFVVTVMAFLLILRRKKLGIVKNQAAPQAKGSWPIIGHLHLLSGSRPPQQVLGDMADKYGPIFTIKLGVHRVLVVSSGEVAKECFTTNDKVFASRPKSKASEIMAYNYAMFGLSPYGDYWRQVRKIVMLELLSQRRVEMLGHVRVSEVRASTKDIYEAWLTNKDSEGSDMIKVDMKQWFGNLVFNVLVRIMSGKRFQLNDEEGVRFQNVARKFFELLGMFVVSDFIPFTNHLDLGGYEKEMKMAGKEMDNIIEGWLKKRTREKKHRQQQDGDQVFMDVLISILKDASEEDFPGYDHETVIKATCLTMITAGSDTTSVTLTWALSLLLNNPNMLKNAQDEIDEHVGRDRAVEESDIKNLVYLDAIIKETLRLYPAAPMGGGSFGPGWASAPPNIFAQKCILYVIWMIEDPKRTGSPTRKSAVGKTFLGLVTFGPPILNIQAPPLAAPLSLPHESMEDCTVCGYNIPKGTRLLVNLWKIHRDPNIWLDPYEFKPERFLTGQKDIDLKGNHFELLPFGSGRRMCPGVFFALQILCIALANVIQQFEINKPSYEPIDMSESSGVTTSKATPLEVLLAPRLSHKMYHVGA